MASGLPSRHLPTLGAAEMAQNEIDLAGFFESKPN